MKIFVSYTDTDQWQVKQIEEILENGGHELWYNRRIIVGQDSKQAKLNAIMDCDAFLWLLSPESVKSESCLWEFKEAVKAHKPIIPVLIQRNTPIPPVLQQRQFADFTEGATPANVARLMAGVQNALHIPVEDVEEILATPHDAPRSVQKPTKDNDELVFISYTHKDYHFAEQVRERLEAAGHRTWMDKFDIPAGALWPEEIDKALNRCTTIVGIVSSDSVQSQNVKNEWSWALTYQVRLILLYLEECKIPHRFIDLSYIDFREDRESKFDELLQQLSKPFNTTYTSPDTRKPLSTPLPTGINKLVAGQSEATTVTSDIPAQPPSSEEIINENEARNRRRMLEKVYNFWIEGVLHNSLHGAVLLDLSMSEKYDAVKHPWNALLRHDDYAENIRIGTGIDSVFDRMSGELLILGQPGSGKTTMLLELCRRLIEYAREDVSYPIPVVFNLSSWADERKPIVDWLVDELNTKYQVPRKVGETWVNNDKLLLLLDGLDEVNIEYRNDCVVAINEYRLEHGLTKLAICSRIADYEALTERLNLQGAVLIQPLSIEQIDEYLASFGDLLSGVREAIHQDSELRELAETPLMLSIMSLAYRNVDTAELITTASPKEKRDRLFDAYVRRMFERKVQANNYSQIQTINWLSWLASNMVARAQTIFLIERLQPDWLDSELEKRKFDFRIRLIASALMGLSVGIPGGISVSFASNSLLIGTIIMIGLTISLAMGVWHARDRNFNLKGGLSLGLCFGLTFGIPAAIASGFMSGILSGFLSGTGLGLIFVYAGKRLLGTSDENKDKVEIVETLNWSWDRLLKGIPYMLAAFLGVGITVGTIIGTVALTVYGLEGVFIAFLIGGSTAGIAMIIPFGIVSGEVDSRTMPNQGIFYSAKNATFLGMVVACISGIPSALAFSILADIWVSVFGGLAIGLVCGLFIWFQFGGRTLIKHITLRQLLENSGRIPRNYADFLDYAVSRVFLRRVGGGYIFIHRMLLEYFADLYQDDDSAKSTS